ncbi:hypothetical protein LB503_011822 [Fusarium chuoi]|nr:hypothetical protein LB503_011822 [Fusarium chuoi]
MIDRNLRSIQSVYKFHGAELSEALGKLASDAIGPKAVELGWTISKNDDENLVTFKTSMFSGADLAGYPRSLRWEVFGIVAAHGGPEELEALVDLWKKSSYEDE